MRVRPFMPTLGVVLAAALSAATNVFAQGCAMCGSSITPDDPLAGALNTSVLFLMVTPYTLVGGVALWLFVQHRRRTLRASGAVTALPWVGTAAPSPSDSKEE